MESKVKIWGKEINICGECLHFSYNDCGVCDCNILSREFELELDPNKNISKYCPFLQPVTKEVIENYGFELVEYQSNNFEWTFRGNIKDRTYNIHYNVDNSLMHISLFNNITWMIFFRGTINNPVEFEFILKSIGVIE